MTTRNSTLVGVFNESAQAERAIEQLHTVGVPDDQITYSGSTANVGSGFVAAIKSFFTGNDVSTNASSLLNDLSAMGLSRDEAQYYASQYRAGRTILAVNAGNQWQNAQAILTSNGAFNYSAQPGGFGTQPVGSGYAQAGAPNYTQNTMPDYTQATDANYDRTSQATDYTRTANSNYDRTGQATGYNQANTDFDQTAQNPNYRQTNAYDQPGTYEQSSMANPADDREARMERRSYGEDRSTNSQDQADGDRQTGWTSDVAPDRRPDQEQRRVSDKARRQETYVDNNGDLQVRKSNTDQTDY